MNKNRKKNKTLNIFVAIVPSAMSSSNCYTTELIFVRQVQAFNTKQTFGASSDHVCNDRLGFVT
jgi:hypothetical protein